MQENELKDRENLSYIEMKIFCGYVIYLYICNSYKHKQLILQEYENIGLFTIGC